MEEMRAIGEYPDQFFLECEIMPRLEEDEEMTDAFEDEDSVD